MPNWSGGEIGNKIIESPRYTWDGSNVKIEVKTDNFYRTLDRAMTEARYWEAKYKELWNTIKIYEGRLVTDPDVANAIRGSVRRDIGAISVEPLAESVERVRRENVVR